VFEQLFRILHLELFLRIFCGAWLNIYRS